MYNHFEIDRMLRSMVILYDTREHETQALRDRLAGFSCPAERRKLDYGDYSVQYTDLGGNIVPLDHVMSVERKMSLDELCACYTSGRERFRREFERARLDGAKIHMIVENATYEKMFGGNYRSRLNPNALTASHLAWAERYRIQLHFCRPETTGKLIYKILYYGLKVYLEQKEAA